MHSRHVSSLTCTWKNEWIDGNPTRGRSYPVSFQVPVPTDNAFASGSHEGRQDGTAVDK
jgi:hypothetical protein